MMVKLDKTDSLFCLCTTCQTCIEQCVMRTTEPGSLHVRTRAKEIIERRASGEFSHLIDKYWYVPRHEGTDQRAFEIIPDGSFDLIFILGETFCRLLFLGPFTRKVFLPIRNSHEYFCIRFHPGRVPQLATCIRSAELVNNGIYLSELLGIETCFLCEHLYVLANFDSKQQFIENIFRKVGLESTVPRNRFQRLAEHVLSFQGQIRVDELASDSGMSCRTLERLFKDEVGIPPKAFIRMIRLQKAVEKLRMGSYGRLTDIAYDSGYTDQSHFIKDFKQLFGDLPSSATPLSSVAFLQFEASDPGHFMAHTAPTESH
ncbi:helix-turn-helix transcriptional regulator [Desulfovibrio inopinatus]|uniref:helix-turn-helix transcriptional regulator n=1 Tax=Desulfovibrio inopinatus TaxID=102109 RepID=UPI000406E54E|nr:helix-turn-helix transcriptional regulator [Desulfovibrio inopinatus]